MKTPNEDSADHHAPEAPPHEVSSQKLADMVHERDAPSLQSYDGIEGLADRLGTSLDRGFHNDFLQLQKQRQKFGANIHRSLSPKGFFSRFPRAVASMVYRPCLQFVRKQSEEMQSSAVNVIREGSRMQIRSSGLVVGDIVFLEEGVQVPADGLLADTGMLCVDVSTVTGESGLIPVNEKMPFLLSGCMVIQGSGKMLVTGVGTKTEWRPSGSAR